MTSDEHTPRGGQRPTPTGKPTGRRPRRVYRHVDPDTFDMEAAIAAWEALTGRRFEGNPATGLPWGMTPEDDEAAGGGEDG